MKNSETDRLSPADKWQETRKVGKWKYIVLYGMVSWGLFVAILVTLFDVVVGWWTGDWVTWQEVAVHFIGFPLGGLGFGAWMWYVNERKYGQ